MKTNSSRFFWVFGLVFFIATQLQGQWFGRNKPNYEKFEFKVKESPNFSLYYYVENDSIIESFLKQSELWHDRHQQIFSDTLGVKNPLILYADHTDFQQTTIIPGGVGVGTGGVTEGMKNRVVMPMMELNSQFDHVLGHELVHVFQYNMLKNGGDSLSLNNIRNLPLWMVEGLAEYLSIGSVDPNTAMWMRDAVLHKDIPTLEKLTQSNEYFPYRYGHAFWSYVTGGFGDSIIAPLFRKTAMYGYNKALKETIGLDEKAFSEAWKKSLTEYYSQFRATEVDSVATGTLLIDPKKAGKLNIAPVISPNGQYVAFLSAKNFFTIDLFLAETKSGKILKTLSSTARQSHIDDFSYVESGGSWSPQGDKFAFTVFSKGKNMLSIVDVGNRPVLTIEIPGVPYFSNPAWSPEGETIVVSGLVEGQSDLFAFKLKSREVIRLTNDWYSDVQPSWSNDGSKIVFVSDRPSPGMDYKLNSLQLSIYEIETNEIRVADIFNGAENLNPVFTPEDDGILFLSNRDGKRNLYKYEVETGNVFQLTNYFTGISGITPHSHSLSVSITGDVAYTYYSDKSHLLYLANLNEFKEVPVDKNEVNFAPGVLPPVRNPEIKSVEIAVADTTIKDATYKPKFSLEYIGNVGGIGISSGSFGNTAMSGGIFAMFSDIMKYHNLYTTLAISGEIYDAGGQIAYLNQKSRVNWGVSLSHIPYRSSNIGYKLDPVNVGDTTIIMDNQFLDIYRLFQENLGVFFYFPLSGTKRFELGTEGSYISFRGERINTYFYNGLFFDQNDEKLPAPPGYWAGNTYAAYVFDNSYFGMASPQRGRRYRIEANQNYGELNFTSATADFRQYAFLNPTSIAFRVIHSGRYGSDAESNRINPLSFAYPGLTRGNNLDNIEGYAASEGEPYSINQIFGSRILVANLEWRVPFTGPERLALLKSKYFFTELNLFVDAGLAWDSQNSPSLDLEPETNQERIPFISAGISMRVNLFGQLVVEPYYAFPWRGNKFIKGNFGLNFIPGW